VETERGDSVASFWVVPYAGGRWGVQREGADEASEVYSTEEGATVRAEQLAKMTGGGDLVVAELDGEVRRRETVPSATGA
jgi:hypothetical protein